MSSSPSTKHEASLTIEDLFLQPGDHTQQKWLLTYIDVFVLIIMLVVTLIALSGFETQQTLKNTESQQQVIHKPSPAEEKIQNTQKFTETEPKHLSDLSLQKQLAEKVKELGLTDAVKMKVTLGYAQLEIQDKILFKSSEATLLNAGEDLLKKLTPLLNQSSGLIYIEGHTDNRPIKTIKFPSNWELGAARATRVLHYFVSQKMDASRLRAITYGETKPIADNATTAGREKNRRVSIVIKVSDKID